MERKNNHENKRGKKVKLTVHVTSQENNQLNYEYLKAQ